MNEVELQKRKRLKADFWYYAKNCLFIRTKDKGLKEFELNRAQLYIHQKLEEQREKTGKVRAIILKGRQQGACLSPDTKVTLGDLTTTTIDDLEVGDSLLAVDEGGVGVTISGRKSTRKMRKALVEAKVEFESELLEIELDNGTKLKCTPNHRWLTRQRGGTYVWWREAEMLKVGDVLRAAHFNDDNLVRDFEDGWVSGALDADGSCSTTGAPRVAFSQVEGDVLARYTDYLDTFKIGYYENVDRRTKIGESTKLGDKPVHCIRVDSFPHIARLISRTIPIRFDIPGLYEGRKLPTSTSTFQAWPAIVSIRSLGVSRVVDIQTSAKTFVAEGVVSHNSTYIEGRFMWRTTHEKGVRAYILTHEDDASQNLFNMAKRYFEHLPTFVKPSTSAANAKELLFNVIDSGYQIGTAGNKSVGRSQTNQYFHGSEVAFWPNASEHAKGILQTVPDANGTEVIYESTANGVGNFFHQQWKAAERGEGDFIPVFVPWFWQDEYRKSVPEGFRLTVEELDLAEQYGLEPEQIFWRRVKIADLSADGTDGERSFKQEYPMNAAEAFQLSGESGLIKAENVVKARKNNVNGNGSFVVGVDPSRGGDRFSIIKRQGRKAYDSQSWTGDAVDKLGKAVGKCKRILDTVCPIAEKKPDMMFIDAGGGADLVDRLHELGYDNVKAIAFGSSPLDDDKYKNKRGEMWGEMNLWLSDENLDVEIPDDDEIQADLCASPYDRDSHDRIVLWRKEKIKKEYGFSPDIGDALALTFAEPVSEDTKLELPNMGGGWMNA